MLTLALSGNTKRPSKTCALVEQIAARIDETTGSQSKTYDLLDIGAQLRACQSLEEFDQAGSLIVRRILAADVLIVGSSVCKGSYSGLFKHFFDLLDPVSLAGKTVALAATGGSERHASSNISCVHCLAFPPRNLFRLEFNASDRDFEDYVVKSPNVLVRIDTTAREVVRMRLPLAMRSTSACPME